MGSVEGCDDQESVCSSNEREGDAFPKAFDRDLVTPTNLQKTHTAESTESTVSPQIAESANKSSIDAETKESNAPTTTTTNTTTTTTAAAAEDGDGIATASASATTSTPNTTPGAGHTSTPKTDEKSNSPFDTSELGRELRSLEERRRSLLDHHWAVPSKDRYKIVAQLTHSNEILNMKLYHQSIRNSNSSKSIEDDSIDETTDTISSIPSTSGGIVNSTANNSNALPNITAASIASISIDNENSESNSVKPSCHDSGIDIRDLNLPSILHAKKNYSDADIVLSSDWVPPITIAPTDFCDTPPRGGTSSLGTSLGSDTMIGARKKTSSVSFSVDDNSENQQSHHPHHHSTSSDKTSDKKNKMLKRLSYPLTWVEGLTGDVKPESTESAPNTGDSNQSVFSKVFSR